MEIEKVSKIMLLHYNDSVSADEHTMLVHDLVLGTVVHKLIYLFYKQIWF